MTTLRGYRELSKRDFTFSKIAAFGLFRRQKIVLKRKPVRRLFALPVRGPRYLDVIFVTDSQEIARGAVDVSVRYFSLGGEIGHDHIVHQLFADPQHHAAEQRLWFKPPKGALFAEVAFSRAGRRGRKIGLNGRLKLTKAGREPGIEDFDTILPSRDVTGMALVLRALEGRQDRARARALLARMCFLSCDAAYASKLTSLDDAERILAYGPNFDLSCSRWNGTDTYVYDRTGLVGELERLPLGKALKAEARRIVHRLATEKAAALEVPEGEDWLGRLLVAAMLKRANADIQVVIDWNAFASTPQALGPWLVFKTGASFLETGGGGAVKLLCTQ